MSWRPRVELVKFPVWKVSLYELPELVFAGPLRTMLPGEYFSPM
jgi:hypothetical protein